MGAAAAQAVARPRQVAVAGLLGALAGMAPDLDVLIRSSVDPLLFLEYHRQFTHSLVFIPLGAALCAAGVFPFVRRRCSAHRERGQQGRRRSPIRQASGRKGEGRAES